MPVAKHARREAKARLQMPVDEKGEGPWVSVEYAPHECRIGHAICVYPRGYRQRHFGAISTPRSMTRSPTSPAKSSLIVVSPGGTIQLPPSIRALRRCVPAESASVAVHRPSAARVNVSGFQFVKSPVISTRRARGAMTLSSYLLPPSEPTERPLIVAAAGAARASGIDGANCGLTRNPSVTKRCSPSRANRPPVAVPAPTTSDSGDESRKASVAEPHEPPGTPRLARRAPIATAAERRRPSQLRPASVSAQRRSSETRVLSLKVRVTLVLSHSPVRLSWKTKTLVQLRLVCLISASAAFLRTAATVTTTFPILRQPPVSTLGCSTASLKPLRRMTSPPIHHPVEAPPTESRAPVLASTIERLGAVTRASAPCQSRSALPNDMARTEPLTPIRGCQPNTEPPEPAPAPASSRSGSCAARESAAAINAAATTARRQVRAVIVSPWQRSGRSRHNEPCRCTHASAASVTSAF